ncbi:MAG: alpha/beta fold hydrolase, partial [Methylococcaceae bacterium]|nr:alpha/beta fold hydrolase [Methylococcaceae bacterium]
AERFLADPFAEEPQARMYKSGDLGRWLADGSIEYLGRNDFQVKIRGFRIELGEIEAQLAEHPSVREAVVLARGEQGDQRLVAYYTGDENLAAEALRTHLALELPDYMIPAAYVKLDGLPLTANGKLDRKALPAPEGEAFARRGYAAPQGEVEETLTRIWAELLKLERVGRHDNFFELGGHSMLAVQAVSMLKQVGIDLPLLALFTNPTIESLAAHAGPQAASGAIPLRAEGTERPLFLIHEVSGEVLYGAALASHLDPAIPVYGLPGAETPLRTVQALATRLLSMIRAVQAEGPYRIAGWSFGGTLAYEIAHQLIGEDETVEFLGLIDTYHLSGEERAEHSSRDSSDDNAFLLNMIGSQDQPAFEALKAIASTLEFAALVRKCQEQSLLPETLTVDEVRRYVATCRANTQANEEYFAPYIPIPIYLYAAQDETGKDPWRGWGSVVAKEQIHVIEVSGTHQTMVESPHVERLAEALSHGIRQVSEKRTSLPELDYSPLLTIQTGRRGTSPVFCVPGAGGNVAALTELAGALGEGWPVHGLQPRGLDGVLVPHSTVQAAAKDYLRAIQTAYPNGPVHLIGHSFGGWVVFEMARTLLEIGREVASLTLIDTEVPHGIIAPDCEYSRTEALMKLIEIFEQAAGTSLGILPDELGALSDKAQLVLLHGRLVRVGLMPKRSEPEALRGTLRTFASCLRTGYQPDGEYPCAMHLVLVRDDSLDEAADSLRNEEMVAGWKHWAPHLLFWQSEGNHMSVIKKPHVDAFIGWLHKDMR